MKRVMKMVPITLLSLIVCMMPVFAMEAVDTDAKGSVTFNGYPADGAVFEFYKVATADEKMYLTLTDTFEPYADQIQINVTDDEPYDDSKAQAVWADTARTLANLVQGEGISPEKIFTNTGEKCVASDRDVGLYLVLSKPIEVGNELYYTLPMLVSIPTNITGEDIPYIQDTEEWVYGYEVDIDINVKYEHQEIPPREYRVRKVWANDGKGDKRPVELVINILKNGKPDQTITLNAANNWTATWMGEKNAKYSVQEAKVPAGYKVSYEENETVFTIKNTMGTPPPYTGDTNHLKWPMIGLTVSGLAAIFAGVILLRDRKQQAQ